MARKSVGLQGQARSINVPLLTQIGWPSSRYPISLSKATGSWTCDFDRSTYVPDSRFITTYYVNRSTGSSGNNGLSSGAAKSGIYQAITLGNATGYPYKVIVEAGTYERALSINNNGTVYPTQDCALIAANGRVVTGNFDALTWGGTKDGTQTNCTVAARTNVGKVVDRLTLDANGDYTPMTRVASAALCNSTPNSYAQVSSNVYVHRTDEALATNANTRVYLNTGAVLYVDSTFAGKRLYVKGFDIEGGGSAAGVNVSSTATDVVAIFDDCTAKYTGREDVVNASDGFAFSGSGLFVCLGCRASTTAKDGFNFHWVGNSTRSSFGLCINCVSRNNGVESTSNSNNGLTIHDNVICVDVAGDYRKSRGGTIRNIGTSRMLCLGTVCNNDQSDGSTTQSGFMVEDSAVIYAVDCSATMDSSLHRAAVATASGSVYLRNFTAFGQLVNTTAMPSNLSPT